MLWTTAFLTSASAASANVSISFSAFSMKEMSLANGGSLRSIVSFSYFPFLPSALQILPSTEASFRPKRFACVCAFSRSWGWFRSAPTKTELTPRCARMRKKQRLIIHRCFAACGKTNKAFRHKDIHQRDELCRKQIKKGSIFPRRKCMRSWRQVFLSLTPPRTWGVSMPPMNAQSWRTAGKSARKAQTM